MDVGGFMNNIMGFEHEKELNRKRFLNLYGFTPKSNLTNAEAVCLKISTTIPRKVILLSL
jgi:hypothetical protein